MKRRDALLGVGVFVFSGCLSAESADNLTSTKSIKEGLKTDGVEWQPNAAVPAVMGELTNAAERTFATVRLWVNYYNDDDVRIDRSATTVEDLTPATTAEFSVFFFGDDPRRVESYELSIDTEWTEYE